MTFTDVVVLLMGTLLVVALATLAVFISWENYTCDGHAVYGTGGVGLARLFHALCIDDITTSVISWTFEGTTEERELAEYQVNAATWWCFGIVAAMVLWFAVFRYHIV